MAKLFAVLVWFVAILAAVTSFGRLSDFFRVLFDHGGFNQALRAMAARSIPTDIAAICFGTVLIFFLVGQIVNFKRSALDVIVLSSKMSPIAICFFALLEFVGWYPHHGELLIHAVAPALTVIVLIVGTVGISVFFYWRLNRLISLPNGLFSYPMYSAFVWANVALVLTLLQLASIAAIRGLSL